MSSLRQPAVDLAGELYETLKRWAFQYIRHPRPLRTFNTRRQQNIFETFFMTEADFRTAFAATNKPAKYVQRANDYPYGSFSMKDTWSCLSDMVCDYASHLASPYWQQSLRTAAMSGKLTPVSREQRRFERVFAAQLRQHPVQFQEQNGANRYDKNLVADIIDFLGQHVQASTLYKSRLSGGRQRDYSVGERRETYQYPAHPLLNFL